jgi:hypothetical protein
MDDVSVPRRWELGGPVDQQGREVEEPWLFKNGVPVRVDGRLEMPARRAVEELRAALEQLL